MAAHAAHHHHLPKQQQGWLLRWFYKHETTCQTCFKSMEYSVSTQSAKSCWGCQCLNHTKCLAKCVTCKHTFCGSCRTLQQWRRLPRTWWFACRATETVVCIDCVQKNQFTLLYPFVSHERGVCQIILQYQFVHPVHPAHTVHSNQR